MLPPEFEFLLAGAPAGGEQAFARAAGEFELFGRLLRLRALEIRSGDVLISGEGSIELEPGGSLDLELRLDFPSGAAARLGKDLRGLFEPSARRPGGMSVSLRLSGPLNAPRTDLLERAARRVARQLGGESDRSEWEERGLSLLQELLK